MIFHLSYEVPKPETRELNPAVPDLSSEEIKILQRQIRSNGGMIDQYVYKLDLLVNKERYPGQAVFIQKIRRRLELLMEENDTFRKVLWKHYRTKGL